MQSVDVIIPVYKPGKELFVLLDRLLEQTVPIRRIILANTEEKYFDLLVQGTTFMEKYGSVVSVFHVSKREFDHGNTRHLAVERSQAEVFVMMTQDALPADRHLLERLLLALSGEGVAAAYARQLPTKGCNVIEHFTRGFNYPDRSRIKTLSDVEEMGVKAYFCSNVCAAYWRDVYEESGGFIRHTIFNEDMIYAAKVMKMGYGVAYAADARVYHSHNYSGRQQFHRNFDLGVSQAEHPEIFEGVPSEGEGIRLVKRSLGYLIRTGHFWLIPQLIWQSGMKYAGYFLGKRYRKLPRKVVLACTMSPYYWNRK